MKKLLFLLTLTTTFQLQTSTPTAKTFFSQSSSPAWMDPFALDTPHRHPHTQPETGLRSTMHIEPFYWHSSNKKKLGNYFGYYDSVTDTVKNFIRVDADAEVSPLRPQDIIHDSANSASWTDAAVNPLSQTLTFNPHIEQYGALIANSMQIGDQFEVHTIMPWLHLTHSLGLDTGTPTAQMVEGKPVTVADFFAGSVKQVATESPDQQDALMYNKLLNRQTCSGLADITVIAVTKAVNDEELQLCIGGIITLPTSSRANAQYLFEPLLGTGGHVVIGGHLNARCAIITIKKFDIELHGLLSISHRVGLSAHETRTPGFQFAVDNGVDAQLTRYALAGKQHTRRLMPLANILTQPVNVTPGNASDLSVGLCASYKWLHTRLIYRYAHTEAEKVTPLVSWPTNTFGLSRLDYAQTADPLDPADPLEYHTFDVASNSSTLTDALLEENILYSSAATPAQDAHTLGATIAGAPFKKWPHTSIALRGHYTFTVGDSFGLAGYGLSAAFSHTF